VGFWLFGISANEVDQTSLRQSLDMDYNVLHSTLCQVGFLRSMGVVSGWVLTAAIQD